MQFASKRLLLSCRNKINYLYHLPSSFNIFFSAWRPDAARAKKKTRNQSKRKIRKHSAARARAPNDKVFDWWTVGGNFFCRFRASGGRSLHYWPTDGSASARSVWEILNGDEPTRRGAVRVKKSKTWKAFVVVWLALFARPLRSQPVHKLRNF